MGKTSHVHTLASCARALEAAPSDLGAWLRLARALAAAGRGEDAAFVFERLGAAASELGQVALAVACCRWLTEAGCATAASSLARAVAELHCATSARIDRSSRPRPPAPPPRNEGAEADAAAPPPRTLDDAVTRARAAVTAAAGAAERRAGDTLPPTPLLSVLDAPEIEELIAMTELVERSAGQVVIDVGEQARSLFWLARGAVNVTRDGAQLGELRSGAFFGEIGLVAGTTRTARVTCSEDCWLLEIPAASVEAIASKAPRLARVLAEYARNRLLANVMRTSELFRRLDDAQRRELLARFEPRLFPAGERIVAEGADNDRLHVIVSGRCEVRTGGQTTAALTVGDGFGEVSLIARKPAIADVVAVDKTVTLSLSRERFDDIAVANPQLLAEVYKLLVERDRAQPIYHDASDLIL